MLTLDQIGPTISVYYHWTIVPPALTGDVTGVEARLARLEKEYYYYYILSCIGNL
jgi:hypothetical protein